MSQLDFLTYSYPFHGLLLSFFVFYIFPFQFVYPSISSALKARAKKLLSDKKDLWNIETSGEKDACVLYLVLTNN